MRAGWTSPAKPGRIEEKKKGGAVYDFRAVKEGKGLRGEDHISHDPPVIQVQNGAEGGAWIEIPSRSFRCRGGRCS